MPAHLVERINASLAAEQAQRTAQAQRTTQESSGSVIPLVTAARRRPTRFVFAIAGTAAAVVLFAVVGSNILSGRQSTATSVSAAVASTSTGGDSRAEAAAGLDARVRAPGGRELLVEAPQSGAKDVPLDRTAGASGVQIRQSATRYTQTDFVTQAGSLRSATIEQTRWQTASGVGPAGTMEWLWECMRSIGAGDVQVIRADVAFYEGRAAVIILATTHDNAVALVVAPQCSHADPEVLRPVTPLR